MKRFHTPWPRRTPSAALCVLLLASGGCVTRGTHQTVVDERDDLARERIALSERVELLETSNESLSAERVTLLEQVEDLRERRDGLERDVRTLGKAHDDLEAELAAREAALVQQSDALAIREAELAELRSTYDGLVGDLEAEVEAGRMQVERLRSGMSIALPNEVLFAAGSARLRESAREVLGRVAARLRESQDAVQVHGHTDNVPISGPLASSYPSNWELAGARAAQVARLLVEDGVDPARIVAVSHAEFAPLGPNDTPEARARNRRIEIRLLPTTLEEAEESLPADGAAP